MNITRSAGDAADVADFVFSGSTPVRFRGHLESARVVSVGINPSVREFCSRDGSELTGGARRFETRASLEAATVCSTMEDRTKRVEQRCTHYFENAPYLAWFTPMEELVQGITGGSFFDGSAYHLDLVHAATEPLWGQLPKWVQRTLLQQDRAEVEQQLSNPALEIVYLNGRTVSEEVGRFVALTRRPAQFRGEGATRQFFRGRHGGALVIGSSSNIQEERLRTDARADFMKWIITECLRDLASLRADA